MSKKRLQSGLFSSIKRHSLTTEMWLVLFAALVVFGVVFTFSLSAIIRETRNNNEMRESETVINSVVGNINANIGNYKDLSRLIMLNKQVMAFLRADSVDAGIINDTKYGMLDILNISDNLDSVYVIRNDGYYASTGRGEYITNFSMMDEDWSTPILEKRGGVVILMNAGGAIYRRNGNQIITIARAIYDIYTQQRTGILLMNISTGMLDQVANVAGDTRVSIISSDGIYLAGDESLTCYYSSTLPIEEIVYKEHGGKGMQEMIST